MTRAIPRTLFDGFARTGLTDEKLVSLSVALGAKSVPDWSESERRLTRELVPISESSVAEIASKIKAGSDPLGEYFCEIRSAVDRRVRGATFTPANIVDWMVRRSADWFARPTRIVEPGAGSARFLCRAGQTFPDSELVGVEIDPLAALLARANLAVLGMARRAKVIVADYREVQLSSVGGKTLYIANPPYVRHHQIASAWKKWLSDRARQLDFDCSQLAGLHTYFYLATVLRAAPGDFGAFITAAEWLDVNYGRLVRELFLGPMGGRRIDVIEPTACAFPDAASTAAITFFEIGARPANVILRRVKTIDELPDLTKERSVRRERLETAARWSHLTRPRKKGPHGCVELGELCRVHRGQVTGANRFWIEGEHSQGLPESVFFPTVTKARELIRAGTVLADASALRRVIDLPVELDEFRGEDRKLVNRFLEKARKLGVPEGYIASKRRAWWSVGLREPAPILATYMARRPPAFVRNRADARHINVAHGLYPREDFGDDVLTRLVNFLSSSVQVIHGRTYSGGLTKFEPREMERLLVPGPELLRRGEEA